MGSHLKHSAVQALIPPVQLIIAFISFTVKQNHLPGSSTSLYRKKVHAFVSLQTRGPLFLNLYLLRRPYYFEKAGCSALHTPAAAPGIHNLLPYGTNQFSDIPDLLFLHISLNPVDHFHRHLRIPEIRCANRHG